ncbi:MAG: hypothetical protein ABJA35_07795 [Parafilimonas sp.]
MAKDIPDSLFNAVTKIPLSDNIKVDSVNGNAIGNKKKSQPYAAQEK